MTMICAFNTVYIVANGACNNTRLRAAANIYIKSFNHMTALEY